MHIGGYVCVEGEEDSRDAGGLRDGGGEGDEEGHREQLGDSSRVEVIDRIEK